MDFVERFSGRGARFQPDALLKFTPLSRPVQQHLGKVYVTLTAALIVSAFGILVSSLLGGFGSWLSALGFIGCSVALLSTQQTPYNLNKRYGFLAGAAFCQGMTVGPLVSAAVDIDPVIPLTAFLATAAVFACFSAAALLAPRRQYLFLGGALSSAVMMMAVMRLGTWVFGRGALAFQAELYGGLLIFLGYVIFDTQVIVEKAYASISAGTKPDHIRAAMDLLVDFFAIFVRLLVILLKNSEKREDSRSRKRRS